MRQILNERPGISQLVALIASAAVLFSAFVPGSFAKNAPTEKLKDEQKILHVLNRLGFGARPGDVERVKAMGLQNYIEQQLHPERINDAVAEAKVKNLATLNMTTAELYEKYPQPGQLLRQLQRRGDLPSDLAAARENRTKNADAAVPPKADATAEMTAPQKNDQAKPNDQADPRNNEKYRQAIRDYYIQNGLQPPQRISAELQASRILRAVYSERQLQEVMVDFWTNHFNVFAGKGADRWLLVSYDRDTIRPNVLGKFSDLLLATAESPAMLFYLDNFQSVSPNAQLGQAAMRQRAGLGQQRGLFGAL